MSEMVEKVLAAMLAEFYKAGEYVDDNGEMVCLDGRFDLRAVARAAIAALREPTPEMVDAAEVASGMVAWDHIELRLRDGHRAAIDVAVGEP